LGVEMAIALVEIEEVEVLDVENDRHEPQATGIARAFQLLALRLAQQEMVDVQEETRLGAEAGDAVDVEVPAVGSEQKVEIDAAASGELPAPVLHEAHGEGLVHLVHVVGQVGLSLLAG